MKNALSSRLDIRSAVPRSERGHNPRWRSSWWPDVRAALPGWLTERMLVLGALGLASYLIDELHPTRRSATLLGWDAAFYRDIGHQGYDLAGGSLRFFPLVPLLSRPLSPFGLGGGGALLLVANASALVGGALLFRLALRETGNAELAQRAAWLFALAPPAFVFTMGYADATGFALAVGAFLALRTKHWGWAAAAAFLAGSGRPSAFLLAVPAGIEAARGLGGIGVRERAARLGAPSSRIGSSSTGTSTARSSALSTPSSPRSADWSTVTRSGPVSTFRGSCSSSCSWCSR
jgi:hypothetical protein